MLMNDPYSYIHPQTRGPQILEAEHVDLPRPGPGEVLVRHEAVGLNFIDTYHRSGLYQLPLPSGLGGEGAGVVEAVGEGVTGFRDGHRVGYFTGPLGSYATHRTIAADRLVRLPDSLSAEQAAAAMLKGCTAEYLVERCARVEAGQTVLVHAAAGGMGSILVQWLKAVGATVIAHAGDSRKAALAAELGADMGDHRRSDRLQPLDQDRAHAARRGVDEHDLAPLDLGAAFNQIFGGAALQHRRRGLLGRDRIGQLHQLVGGDRPMGRVGSERPGEIADPVPFLEAADALTDRLDDPRAFAAQP